MKLFYFGSIVIVALLVAAPMYLLTGQAAYSGDQVVYYSSYGSRVRSIDPATCGDTTSAMIQGNFYEGLYTYHFLKRPLELEPMLAEDMPEVSEDGLVYTIRIKPGTKYRRNPCFGVNADGTAKTRTVRADDFVLALKRVADYHVPTQLSMSLVEDKIAGIQKYRDLTSTYGRGDFARYNMPLEGVEALDELTLRITLTRPFPQFTHVLAMHNFAPYPREAIDYYLTTGPDGRGGRREIPIEKRTPVVSEPEAAVGTGAYYLDTWVKGSKIVLRRNEDFRDESYPSEGEEGDAEAGLLADAGNKVPFIDVVDMTCIEEDNPAWSMFTAGLLDASYIPPAVFSNVVAPGRKLTGVWARKGIKLLEARSPVVYWFAFNMDDRVVGNSKSLRQAMTLAFNVEQYIESIHNGRGIRAVNCIPSSFDGHADAGASPYAVYDVELARQKVEQARRELVAAGVIRPGEPIPPITLDLGGRDEQSRKVGEFARDMFSRIGVTLKIELNDWPLLQDKVHTKQVQMYAMGWHADYPDAENFLQLYYSPNIQRGTNNTNYSSAEFDRMFERAAVMNDSPERTELYVKMIRMISEDCPVLLLSEPIGLALMHPWVHNRKPHPIAYGHMKYIRLDSELRRQIGGR